MVTPELAGRPAPAGDGWFARCRRHGPADARAAARSGRPRCPAVRPRRAWRWWPRPAGSRRSRSTRPGIAGRFRTAVGPRASGRAAEPVRLPPVRRPRAVGPAAGQVRAVRRTGRYPAGSGSRYARRLCRTRWPWRPRPVRRPRPDGAVGRTAAGPARGPAVTVRQPARRAGRSRSAAAGRLGPAGRQSARRDVGRCARPRAPVGIRWPGCPAVVAAGRCANGAELSVPRASRPGRSWCSWLRPGGCSGSAAPWCPRRSARTRLGRSVPRFPP